MIDLYRFFDASERLLYVGISLSAIQRANEHRKEKPWWPNWRFYNDDGFVTAADKASSLRDENPRWVVPADEARAV